MENQMRIRSLLSIGMFIFMILSLSSCFSVETQTFVESRAKDMRRMSLVGIYEPYQGYQAVDVLELEGLSIYFHQSKVRYTSSRCFGTVLIIPIDYQHHNEKDLNPKSQSANEFKMEIGFSAIGSEADVELHDFSLKYGGSTYRPIAVSYVEDDELSPHERTPSTDTVHIQTSAEPIWYELTFGISELNPKDEFSLTIKNIHVNGRGIEINPISFGPREGHFTRDYGERGC